MILLPGQLEPPPPPPTAQPTHAPVPCECGKRYLVPVSAIANGNTIHCPWCSHDFVVRLYTDLLTGRVTVHFARRLLDDIWLPENFAR